MSRQPVAEPQAPGTPVPATQAAPQANPPSTPSAATPTSTSSPSRRIADARNAIRHVFIRDLILACHIGVHRHEETAAQRVRINLDLAVREDAELRDDLGNVVCYERIGNGVRAIVASRHIRLVETLAEEIAAMCLGDGRIRSVRVCVEKLDAFADAASVGVEIERFPDQR